MKVKIREVHDHFVDKNKVLDKNKILKQKTKVDKNSHLVLVNTISEGPILIRKDLNDNFIELNHGNIILDIVGKTKGAKIYKRGDNYLLV